MSVCVFNHEKENVPSAKQHISEALGSLKQ